VADALGNARLTVVGTQHAADKHRSAHNVAAGGKHTLKAILER